MTEAVTPVRDDRLLRAAQVYLQKGWSVFPVTSGGEYDKRPHLSLVDTGHSREDGGKARPSWKPLMTQRPTEDHLRTWFTRPKGKGLALVTGSLSGVVILDFDGDEGVRLVEELGLPPHVRTGSGGYHVYFRHPGHAVQTLNSKAKHDLGQRWPGLDIRADGGYAILPPSRNNSGEYQQLRSFDELEDVSALPRDLAEFLGLIQVARAPASLPPRAATGLPQDGRVRSDLLLDRALERVGPDGRNNAGMWLACQLRDNGYSEHEAEQVMALYTTQVPTTNAKGRTEPYTFDEARTTLRSAYSQPARDPWTPSDRGRGELSQSDSGLRARAPQVSPSPLEVPDEGDVFVVAPAHLPDVAGAISSLRPGFTVRTPNQLGAEYLDALRRDGRPIYAVRPSQELTRRLDRAGVEWHALRVDLPGVTPTDTLERLEAGAATVIEAQMQGDAGFLLETLPEALNARAGKKGALYPLGLPQLDAALGGGLYPGLHVLGGVTAGGKTALALHIAESNARAGRPVLFVTYEQSKGELWTRIVSPRVGISIGAFRSGEYSGRPLGQHLQEQEAYRDLAQNVAPYLRVFEGDGASGAQQWGVERISAEVRRLRALYGQAPLVILDYLQRMPSDVDSDKRHKVDDVVMALQVRLGREEQTPLLLLSSVSRGNYGELLLRPLDERLAVFKESGGIEYTAYSALLIYPLSTKNLVDLGLPQPPAPGSAAAALKGAWRYVVLDLVKNREGEPGLQLALKWWPAQARYEVVGPLDTSGLEVEPVANRRR